MRRKVLITGASGGLGRLQTKTMLGAGHAVVAAMRQPESRNRVAAEELRQAGATIVEIDVTDDSSVTAGTSAAIRAVDGLDVLINNAGVGVLGVQETFTPDDVRRLFEVNVFGVQRMTRAALPFLRAQGSGLVLFISSLLGRFALPFYGPYNASKWALEALAETYRVELSALGIDCAIVEPGGFPTDFMDRLMRPSEDAGELGYDELAEAPEALFRDFEQALAANPAQDPQLVADAVAGLVAAEPGARPFRTVVDRMGMGPRFEPYNEQLEAIMRGIYGAFGMRAMLQDGGSS